MDNVENDRTNNILLPGRCNNLNKKETMAIIPTISSNFLIVVFINGG